MAAPMLTRGRVAALLSLLAGVILFGYHARRVFISRRRRRYRESGLARELSVSPGIRKRSTPLGSSPGLRRHTRHGSGSSSAPSPECRHESRAAQSLGSTSETDPEDRWKLSSPSALSSLSSLTENTTDTDTEIEEARPTKSTPKQKRRFFTKKSKLPTSKRKAKMGVAKTSESESDTFEPGKRSSTWRKAKGGSKAKEDITKEAALQAGISDMQHTTKFENTSDLSSDTKIVKDVKGSEIPILHKENLPSCHANKDDSDKTLTSDASSGDEHLLDKSQPPADTAHVKSDDKVSGLYPENLNTEDASADRKKCASAKDNSKSMKDNVVDILNQKAQAEPPNTPEEKSSREELKILHEDQTAPTGEVLLQTEEECSITVTIPFPKYSVTQEEVKQDGGVTPEQSATVEKDKLSESKIKKPGKVLSKVAMFEKAPQKAVEKKKKEDTFSRRNSVKEENQDDTSRKEGKSEKGAEAPRDSLSSVARLKSKLLNNESKQTGEIKQAEGHKVPSKFGIRWKRKNEEEQNVVKETVQSVDEEMMSKRSDTRSEQVGEANSEQNKSEVDGGKTVEESLNTQTSIMSKVKGMGKDQSNLAKLEDREKEKTACEDTSSVPKQKPHMTNLGKQNAALNKDRNRKDMTDKGKAIEDDTVTSLTEDLPLVTSLGNESIKSSDGVKIGEKDKEKTFPSTNKDAEKSSIGKKPPNSTTKDGEQKGEKSMYETVTSVKQKAETSQIGGGQVGSDQVVEEKKEFGKGADAPSNASATKQKSNDTTARTEQTDVKDEKTSPYLPSGLDERKLSQSKAEEIKPKKQISSSVAQIQSRLANLGAVGSTEMDKEDSGSRNTAEALQLVKSGVGKEKMKSEGTSSVSVEASTIEKDNDITEKPDALLSKPDQAKGDNSNSSSAMNKVLMKVAMFEQTKSPSVPNERFRRKSVASIYPVTDTKEDISLIKNRFRFLGEKSKPFRQLSLDDTSLLTSSKLGLGQTPELEGKPGNVLKKIKAFQQGIEGNKDTEPESDTAERNEKKQGKIEKFTIIEKDSSPALGAESGIGSEEEGDTDMYESGYCSPPVKSECASTSPLQQSSFNKQSEPKEDFSITDTTGMHDSTRKSESQYPIMISEDKEVQSDKNLGNDDDKSQVTERGVNDPYTSKQLDQQIGQSEPVMHGKDHITIQMADSKEQACEEVLEKEVKPQESSNVECTAEACFSLPDKEKIDKSPNVENEEELCQSPTVQKGWNSPEVSVVSSEGRDVKRKLSKSSEDPLLQPGVPLSEGTDKSILDVPPCGTSEAEDNVSIEAKVSLCLAVDVPPVGIPDHEKSLLSVGDRDDQESSYSGHSSVTILSQTELDNEGTNNEEIVTSVSQDFDFLQTGEIVRKEGKETSSSGKGTKPNATQKDTEMANLQNTPEFKENDTLGVSKLKKFSKSEPKGRRQFKEESQIEDQFSEEILDSESEDETPVSGLAMKIALCDSKRELELKKKPQDIEEDKGQTSSKLPVLKSMNKMNKSQEAVMSRSAGEVEMNQAVERQSNIPRAKTEERTISIENTEMECSIGHGLSKSLGDLGGKSKSSVMPSKIPSPGTKTPPRKMSASAADHGAPRRSQDSAIPRGAFNRSKSEGRQSQKKKAKTDDLIMLMSKSLGDSEADYLFQETPCRVPVLKESPSRSKVHVDEIAESKIIKPKDSVPKQYGFNEPEKKSSKPSRLPEVQKSSIKIGLKREQTDTQAQCNLAEKRQKSDRLVKMQQVGNKIRKVGNEEERNDSEELSDVDISQGCNLPHTTEDSWSTGTVEEFLNAFSEGGYVSPKEALAQGLTTNLPSPVCHRDRHIVEEHLEEVTGTVEDIDETPVQSSMSEMEAYSTSESGDDAGTLDGVIDSIERDSELDQQRRKSQGSLYDDDSLDGASLGRSAKSDGGSDDEDDEGHRFQFGSNEIIYEHPQDQAMSNIIYEGYEYEEEETSFIDDTIQEEEDSAETEDLIDWGDTHQSPGEAECETDSLEEEDDEEGREEAIAEEASGLDDRTDDTQMQTLLGQVLGDMDEEIDHSGSGEAVSEEEEFLGGFCTTARHHESTDYEVSPKIMGAQQDSSSEKLPGDWYESRNTGSASGGQDRWVSSSTSQHSPWIPQSAGGSLYGSRNREDNRVLFMQGDDTWSLNPPQDQTPYLLPPPGTGRGRRVRPRAVQPDSPRSQPRESHSTVIQKPLSRRQSKDNVPESVLERVPLLFDSSSSMTGSSDSIGLDKEGHNNLSFSDSDQVTPFTGACVSDPDGPDGSDFLSDETPAEREPEDLIFQYGLRPDTSLDDNLAYRRELKEMFRTLEKGMYRMTRRHAEILVHNLATQDFDFLCKVLITVSNAGAFTRNQDLLREAGCLERLGRLLRGHSMALHVGQSLHYPAVVSSVATTISNLAVNEENQTQLQECIPALIDFAVSEESPESVQLSSLQALTNLSVSPGFHAPYTKLVQTLYELVDSHDEPRQLQALKVLVNLSANSEMVPHLLAAKAPARLLELLSPGTDEGVTLRWMNILANVIWTAHDRGITYAALPTEYKAPSPETLYTALYGHSNSVQLRSKVFLLSKNKNPDIRYHAARIYSCLV